MGEANRFFLLLLLAVRVGATMGEFGWAHLHASGYIYIQLRED